MCSQFSSFDCDKSRPLKVNGHRVRALSKFLAVLDRILTGTSFGDISDSKPFQGSSTSRNREKPLQFRAKFKKIELLQAGEVQSLRWWSKIFDMSKILTKFSKKFQKSSISKMVVRGHGSAFL